MRIKQVKRFVLIIIAVLMLPSLMGSNLQRTYTARDWEYRLTDMLCREAGVVGTPGVSPFPASGLIMVLDRIDPARLSPESRKDYEELYEKLSSDGEATVFTYDWMSVETDAGVNIGFNIADYDQFDWSNTTSEEEYVRDRHNETLVPFRYDDPFLSLQARVYFGSWFQLEGGISVNNNSHHLYESSLGWLVSKYKGELLGMWMHDQYPAALQFDFPWRAGLSVGNEYFSFILGRYPFSVGTGVTGNLVAGDNFSYQEIAQMTFMNNYFTYSLSLANFDQQIPGEKDNGEFYSPSSGITSMSAQEFSGDQQYRIIHHFDINIMNYVRLTFDLGTIYNSDNGFDIRLFYPFFFHHNLSNYTNDTAMSYYDEANNIMGFTLEGALPLGLSASFSFLLDQAQTFKEDSTSVPAAYGLQANIKHTIRTSSGRFNSFLEFVLTNPYLYLNGKTYTDPEYGKCYNYNLDYIVGYYSMNYSDVGYAGYVWGPDSIVLAAGTEYISDNDFTVAFNALYRMQGENGYRIRSERGPLDHHYTYIDMKDAVFIADDGSNPQSAPSGPWEKVEHMLRLALTASYTFDLPNIELYAGVAAHIYWNYEGVSTADGIFKPQAMIGVKWTGLDKAWWGK